MRLLNFTPFAAAGVCLLLVEVLKGTVPTWLGWAIVVVVVSVYGGIAEAIVRWFYRDDHALEVYAQTATLDAHFREIERRYGVASRRRAEKLKIPASQLADLYKLHEPQTKKAAE